ncbi:unnamed protein product [Kuraishia capsulata CBS 1993]|uniref:Uncharacterized protein n=1 Tax=Kuraishia capsulata CBS 1993 TaxID=1382522 RepID=W6MXA7_9ASCO|nr:uncharacterized protein KUCA_T00004543001 [Kuraishia capsulata CBS 1993]CDK28560.1 unnamed protein product [Kuraishia capsulata CBS 1993]
MSYKSSPTKISAPRNKVFKRVPKKRMEPAEAVSTTRFGTLQEMEAPKVYSNIRSSYFAELQAPRVWNDDIKSRSSMENFPAIPQFAAVTPFRIATPLAGFSRSSVYSAGEVSDPLLKLVSNSRSKQYQLGSRKVTLQEDGSIQTTGSVEIAIQNTPAGSKRTLDYLEFTNVVLPQSPFSSMLLSAKKRRYQTAVIEKLDNSRTVNVKDILRMVDDSLVSSDTESMTFGSNNGKEQDVSISADDLNFAKLGELEELDHRAGFKNLHSIAINNNYKSMALKV